MPLWYLPLHLAQIPLSNQVQNQLSNLVSLLQIPLVLFLSYHLHLYLLRSPCPTFDSKAPISTSSVKPGWIPLETAETYMSLKALPHWGRPSRTSMDPASLSLWSQAPPLTKSSSTIHWWLHTRYSMYVATKGGSIGASFKGWARVGSAVFTLHVSHVPFTLVDGSLPLILPLIPSIGTSQWTWKADSLVTDSIWRVQVWLILQAFLH